MKGRGFEEALDLGLDKVEGRCRRFNGGEDFCFLFEVKMDRIAFCLDKVEIAVEGKEIVEGFFGIWDVGKIF